MAGPTQRPLVGDIVRITAVLEFDYVMPFALSGPTVRKDLGTLQAAINYHTECYIIAALA